MQSRERKRLRAQLLRQHLLKTDRQKVSQEEAFQYQVLPNQNSSNHQHYQLRSQTLLVHVILPWVPIGQTPIC